MEARNVTASDLQAALDRINAERYEGNVTFNRYPEQHGKALAFTLRVSSSKGPGHRRGFTYGKGRRLTSACWHVHGHFFDALLAINPDAVIRATGGRTTIKIDRLGGNWMDRDIGSMMSPLMFSEACDCAEEGRE